MTRFRKCLFAMGVLGFLCGPAPAERVLLDGVAAHVNEHVITIAEVQALVEPVGRQLIGRFGTVETRTRLRKVYQDSLETLVERRLILDAYEALEQKLPEWVVDERVDELVEGMFGGDRARLMTELSKEQMSFDEWRDEVAGHIAVSYMRRGHVEEHVHVSPRAVREAYEKDRERFRTAAKLRLRMIMLEKKGTADDVAAKRAALSRIRERALAGEDFAMLAKEVSEGGKADAGGDWGWIEPKILRADLADAVQALKPGEVSDAIETGNELYLLRVEGRKDEAVQPFDDVCGEIERGLRREESRRLYKAWTARLRAHAYVRVFPVKLY